MNPIRLHGHGNGEPFFLNADHVETWERKQMPSGNMGTSIRLQSGYTLGVSESPEEIVAMIRAWYSEGDSDA